MMRHQDPTIDEKPLTPYPTISIARAMSTINHFVQPLLRMSSD